MVEASNADDEDRVVFALFIVNKAGSLIYQRDFAEGLQKLSTNEYIILAGTFHRYALSLLSLFSQLSRSQFTLGIYTIYSPAS